MSLSLERASAQWVPLQDYAGLPQPACLVCQLPRDVRDQVERCRIANPKRFTYPLISSWLLRQRHERVSRDSLRRHFKNGHHEPGYVPRAMVVVPMVRP